MSPKNTRLVLLLLKTSGRPGCIGSPTKALPPVSMPLKECETQDNCFKSHNEMQGI
uniref:Uncharacterized protein n=1 Tax=Ditylenchus dipsaci TaxID=166011 RepID=A0A915CV08_9BILA